MGCDHVLLVRARAEAQRYLLKAKEDSPVLVSLYERVVADRFDLGLHGRNQWLTAAVPFIFRAFSRYIGVRLALLHLRAHRALYRGDEAEHKASFDSLWAGCESTYPNELSPAERGIYSALCGYDQDAFRICRDLARRDTGLEFFLACDHLALRLARPGDFNGWRLLRTFQRLGIIAVVEKGTVRVKGQRTHATRYRWTFAA